MYTTATKQILTGILLAQTTRPCAVKNNNYNQVIMNKTKKKTLIFV